MFFQWLDKDMTVTELGTAITTAIKAFAVTGVLAYKSFWAKHYRAGIPGMDTTTTSSAEAMNSSIKSGVLATKSQYSIAKSAATQVDKSNYLAKQREVEASKGLNRTPTYSRTETAQTKHLTDYAEQLGATWLDDSARLLVVRST